MGMSREGKVNIESQFAKHVVVNAVSRGFDTSRFTVTRHDRYTITNHRYILPQYILNNKVTTSYFLLRKNSL